MADGDVALHGQNDCDPDGGEEGDVEEDGGDVQRGEEEVLVLTHAAHHVLRHDVGRQDEQHDEVSHGQRRQVAVGGPAIETGNCWWTCT